MSLAEEVKVERKWFLLARKLVSCSKRQVMNRRKQFPSKENRFSLAGMKNSFKNTFPLGVQTGSTNKNW